MNLQNKQFKYIPSIPSTLYYKAHPPEWAYECLGTDVTLGFKPTRGGLIIQCERYKGLAKHIIHYTIMDSQTECTNQTEVNNSPR